VKKLVVWSGGADSTLVLHDLAKAESIEPFPEPVRSISFEVSQCPGAPEQARARARILEWFKAREYPVSNMVVKIDSGDALERYGNPQATLWMLALQALRPDENLYSGYHRGDDFWHGSQHLVYSFHEMQKLGTRTGVWLFPLETLYKYQVIERLKKTGEPGRPETSLYPLVWFCGRPTKDDGKPHDDPCGRCQPCITHALALSESALRQVKEAEAAALGPPAHDAIVTMLESKIAECEKEAEQHASNG
jgi:7-cyano-7-deazaguanine synthase in queuosine biosynthesis